MFQILNYLTIFNSIMELITAGLIVSSVLIFIFPIIKEEPGIRSKGYAKADNAMYAFGVSCLGSFYGLVLNCDRIITWFNSSYTASELIGTILVIIPLFVFIIIIIEICDILADGILNRFRFN